MRITMTDKDVERVARALGRSVDSFADLDAVTLDQETLLIRGEGAKEWERFIPEARAMIAAHESAVTEIAKLGTVSLTSFDGHCVRIDFPNREDAERMYAVLTKGSE
jgi:hypothetical protein